MDSLLIELSNGNTNEAKIQNLISAVYEDNAIALNVNNNNHEPCREIQPTPQEDTPTYNANNSMHEHASKDVESYDFDANTENSPLEDFFYFPIKEIDGEYYDCNATQFEEDRKTSTFSSTVEVNTRDKELDELLKEYNNFKKKNSEDNSFVCDEGSTSLVEGNSTGALQENLNSLTIRKQNQLTNECNLFELTKEDLLMFDINHQKWRCYERFHESELYSFENFYCSNQKIDEIDIIFFQKYYILLKNIQNCLNTVEDSGISFFEKSQILKHIEDHFRNINVTPSKHFVEGVPNLYYNQKPMFRKTKVTNIWDARTEESLSITRLWNDDYVINRSMFAKSERDKYAKLYDRVNYISKSFKYFQRTHEERYCIDPIITNNSGSIEYRFVIDNSKIDKYSMIM